jgi:hypothetical protein
MGSPFNLRHDVPTIPKLNQPLSFCPQHFARSLAASFRSFKQQVETFQAGVIVPRKPNVRAISAALAF